jgi:lysozyme
MSFLNWFALGEFAWEAIKHATSNIPEDVPIKEPKKIEALQKPLPISSKGMRTSARGQIELANYEGLAQTKYIDSGGVHTIGIGMTVSEIPDLVKWSWNRALDIPECVKLFQKALVKYENAVNRSLRVPVTQAQFDALVSITYNIGTGGMAGSTFMRRLNAKANPKDVVSSMQAWCNDNGRKINGLVIRRKAEGQIFLTGRYQNDGTVALISVNSKHKPVYNRRVNIEKYI